MTRSVEPEPVMGRTSVHSMREQSAAVGRAPSIQAARAGLGTRRSLNHSSDPAKATAHQAQRRLSEGKQTAVPAAMAKQSELGESSTAGSAPSRAGEAYAAVQLALAQELQLEEETEALEGEMKEVVEAARMCAEGNEGDSGKYEKASLY